MKEVPLNKGFVALVDDDMFDLVAKFKWIAAKRGHCHYAQGGSLSPFGRFSPNGRAAKARTPQRTIYMHRLILGVTDPKIFIDHIDHNPLNNQRSNLRICTRSQNAMNMRKGAGVSKYKGVYPNKDKKTEWTAMITIDRKHKMIGSYQDEREAAMAYNKEASILFGEFACLNKIE